MNLLVVVFAAASLLSPELAEMEREELTHPIHPGNPDAGVPFWNACAFRYIYPPAFDFVKWPKAQHYRFKVYDANDKVRYFEAKTPWAPLTPVWADLPVGRVTVICDAMGEGGQVVVKYCGTRTFWKDHPFGGRVAPKPRSYREAAIKAYDYILEFPPVKKFLETGTPDRKYDKFGYPSKTYSSLIKAMVFYARLRPEKKDVAMKLAKMCADEIAKESFPADFALAGWPRTYTTTDGQRCVFPKKKDQVMLIYPLEIGEALVALAQATGDKGYLERAKAIADLYLKIRRPDGTWPLMMDAKTGSATCANNLVAFELLTLFDALAEETGSAVYAAAAKDAFAWLDEHALKDWYWEGQFEDVEQRPKYDNLTGNLASKACWTLVARFPNDPQRLAQARDCVRFHEDQFVFWEQAFNTKDGTQPSRPRRGAVGRHFNTTPGVCEQYDCYCLVNASGAHAALAWRALGKATGNALDLAKARTMADQIVNIQQENGCIPTWWSPSKDEWINCHIFTANALYELSKDE